MHTFSEQMAQNGPQKGQQNQCMYCFANNYRMKLVLHIKKRGRLSIFMGQSEGVKKVMFLTPWVPNAHYLRRFLKIIKNS